MPAEDFEEYLAITDRAAAVVQSEGVITRAKTTTNDQPGIGSKGSLRVGVRRSCRDSCEEPAR